FARTANADPSGTTTAALAAQTGHGCSSACEARKQVVELCQFHLKLTFAAARVASENIQNQLRAVDDATLGGGFDVALLHGGKVAVEDDQWRLVSGGFGANFFQLATTNQRRRIGDVANLINRPGNVGPRTLCQFDQFVQRFATMLCRAKARNARGALP